MTNNFEKTQEEIQGFSLIAKGAGVSLLGSVFGKIFALFSQVIIARCLGPALLGIYGILVMILSFFSVIFKWGLDLVAPRFIPEYQVKNEKEKLKGFIWFTVLFSFLFSLLGVLILVFSKDFLEEFFKKKGLAEGVFWFSFSLPLLILTTLLGAITRGFKVIRYEAFGNSFLKPFFQFLVVFVFLYFLGWKLKGVILGYFLASLFALFYLFWGLRKIFPQVFSLSPLKIEAKKILKAGFFVTIASLFSFIGTQLDIFLLGYFKPAKIVGFYKCALGISSLMLFLGMAFNSLFLPLISESYQKRDSRALAKYFKTATRWQFYSALIFGTIVFLSYKEILLVFGKEFLLAKSALFLLILAQIINLFLGSTGGILVMIKKEKWETFNNFFFLGTNLILGLILIPKFSLLGASLMILIGLSLSKILRLIEVYKFLKIHPFELKMLKGVLASILSFGIAFLIKKSFFSSLHYVLNIFLSSLVLFFTFIFFLFLFKIEKEEKILLQKFFYKILKGKNNLFHHGS